MVPARQQRQDDIAVLVGIRKLGEVVVVVRFFHELVVDPVA